MVNLFGLMCTNWGGGDSGWCATAGAEQEVVVKGGILAQKCLKTPLQTCCQHQLLRIHQPKHQHHGFSGLAAQGGESSDLVTYGSRADRKGSACQLWHACHRFAITVIDKQISTCMSEKSFV